MTTTETLARRAGWRGLETLGLAGTSLALFAMLALDYFLYDALITPVLVFAVVTLAAAGLTATRLRWMPMLGVAVAAVFAFQAIREPFVLLRLTNPESVWTFLATSLMLAFDLVALVGGIGAITKRARQLG